jgi:hypothetical protein
MIQDGVRRLAWDAKLEDRNAKTKSKKLQKKTFFKKQFKMTGSGCEESFKCGKNNNEGELMRGHLV